MTRYDNINKRSTKVQKMLSFYPTLIQTDSDKFAFKCFNSRSFTHSDPLSLLKILLTSELFAPTGFYPHIS